MAHQANGADSSSAKQGLPFLLGTEPSHHTSLPVSVFSADRHTRTHRVRLPAFHPQKNCRPRASARPPGCLVTPS